MEQLKIDIVATTSKFDQQVRASGRMIQNFTDMIRRSGGSIDEVTKKFDTDATIIVRSMGNMKISATDTRGAFKQLNTALQELRILYNNLSKEERNSAFGLATQKSIQELQMRVKGLKTDLAGLNAESAGKSASSGLFGMRFASYAKVGALFASINLLKRALTDAIQTNMEFEQANANLAAILGKTNDEISALTINAKQLGATTVWTAGQITELQTTLARRGIGQADILNMTEGISQLATATGIDLARAAEIAGSAMQSFGLDSKQMGDIAATLGVSTTKSALTMEKLQTSLAYVAPAAKAAGFSMQETIAMLGVLADSGLPATTAGVAVRNILIDISKSSSKLATAIGHPVHGLDELTEVLEDLKKRGGNGLEFVSSLVEKRVVPGFTTLMNNTAKMRDLRDSITDVKDELQDMAEKQINTLKGSTILLKSAWDGLMLSFSNSTGTIKAVTDNLTKLLNAYTAWRNRRAGGDIGISTYEKGADITSADADIKQMRGAGMSDKDINEIASDLMAQYEQQRASIRAVYDTLHNITTTLKGKELSAAVYDFNKEYASFFSSYNKQTDGSKSDYLMKKIAELNDKIATQQYIVGLTGEKSVATTTSNGDGSFDDGDTGTGKSPAKIASERVAKALHKFEVEMVKITEEFRQGVIEGPAALRKIMSAKERVYTAYADAFEMTGDEQYKDGMKEWIAKTSESAAKLSTLNDAIEAMRDAAREAARELQNRKAIDNRTLNSLMGVARKNNIAYEDVGLSGIKTQINSADYFDITDDQWQQIEDKFNEKLAELHLDPIKIDFETGTIQQLSTEMKDVNSALEYASQAVGSVGSALAGLEDPAANVLGLIAQAIANVVAGLGAAIAQKGKDIEPWSWIAFSAAAASTMLTTVEAIKRVTAEYHAGGEFVGSGSRFSTMMRPVGTDTIPAMLSPGELILNKSQQSNLASNLQAAPALADLHLETTIEAERIRIMLNNNNRRRGRGIAIQ